MKLRIKNNSVRYRLSKSDVSNLANSGYLEEQTQFLDAGFIYALQVVDEIDELKATLSNNKITMFVPASFVKAWPENNTVGCEAYMPLSATEKLYLLLEKDFVCLDVTNEDQSDNFENPNKTC